MSSTRITDISYDYQYDESGLGTLTLYFSGEKTYDYSGTKNLCGVMWVLMDEAGEIIANDIFYLKELETGNTFSKETCSVFDLLSGTYQLELYNIGSDN